MEIEEETASAKASEISKKKPIQPQITSFISKKKLSLKNKKSWKNFVSDFGENCRNSGCTEFWVPPVVVLQSLKTPKMICELKVAFWNESPAQWL